MVALVFGSVKKKAGNSLRAHLRKAAAARWAKATPVEKSQAAGQASKAFWARLTPAERGALMKARWEVRRRNKPSKP